MTTRHPRDLAAEIVRDLRTDPETRRHFSMSSWAGMGTCDTVGCIAGTAILRSDMARTMFLFGPSRRILDWRMSCIAEEVAAELLGISEAYTAGDLFMPSTHVDRVLGSKDPFAYLPSQARPPAETVARMREWAESARQTRPDEPRHMCWWTRLNRRITPDQAATALERVALDDVPWCDWSEAMAEEPA